MAELSRRTFLAGALALPVVAGCAGTLSKPGDLPGPTRSWPVSARWWPA
ncbi:MAG: twin-arginine translocation signal domain-containing protein [Geodermatophilaceae bacterium]|nr:twin-arginine translocation signal domain-containing protein [Geodermatophilaceae bacterium]